MYKSSHNMKDRNRFKHLYEESESLGPFIQTHVIAPLFMFIRLLNF